MPAYDSDSARWTQTLFFGLKQRGMTLAELAVVVVLIGLALGLVLPRFIGLGEGERLRMAARLLAGQVQEAHNQAATSSRPAFLCLDLTHRRIWLTTLRPTTLDGKTNIGEPTAESRAAYLPNGVTIKDVIHPTLGTTKEGRLAFGYWPQGGSEPGTIHLIGADNKELTIFLRPYLGQTEIKEGYLREVTK